MKLFPIKFFVLILAIILITLSFIYAHNNLGGWFANPTSQAKQMILVTADNWASTTGTLQLFERDDVANSWKNVGDKITVNLGKNGMGWGIGLHGATLTFAPKVIEGAKKTPVGVFAINLAFGKKNLMSPAIKIPYKQITNSVFCPDDVSSKFYNNLVDTKEVKKDWNSAEDMHDYMQQGLYTYGFIVTHNYKTPIAGRGSCFFVHIYRGVGIPTAGCTAFAPELVKSVIFWLDSSKQPILVQLPKPTYELFKKRWKLPEA